MVTIYLFWLNRKECLFQRCSNDMSVAVYPSSKQGHNNGHNQWPFVSHMGSALVTYQHIPL